MRVENPGRRRLAVLGSPIAHSKSPAIHTAAYRVLGLDWEYGRAEVGARELAGFVASLAPEWRGLSLTMPLKREAPEVASLVDPLAAELRQANTLLLGDDGVRAFSTDVQGIAGALDEAGIPRIDRAVVLGGGATAECAAIALRGLGAEVEVAVRSTDRAAHLAALGRIVSLEDVELDVEVVVSTVPGGDVAVPLPARVEGLLLDAAYDPWPTPVATAWTAAGGRAASGLGILLHQALAQVRIFVLGDPDAELPDEPAVFEAMRAAVAGS